MLNDERHDDEGLTAYVRNTRVDGPQGGRDEVYEVALHAAACRCARAVLVTVRALPAGAMVAWPCLGLSVSRPVDDDAGTALLMTLRVRQSGAVLRLRDAPQGLAVYESRTWGSLAILHRQAAEIGSRIEGAVDLAAFSRAI